MEVAHIITKSTEYFLGLSVYLLNDTSVLLWMVNG